MELWREELYHHGILGQKWGVRRYQNPDGTRTAAGKKRYSSEIGKTNSSPGVSSFSRPDLLYLSRNNKRNTNDRQNKSRNDKAANSSQTTDKNEKTQDVVKILNNSSNATNQIANIYTKSKDITTSVKRNKEAKNNPDKIDISKMSDKELRDVVNRLNLEQQYSNLNSNYVKSGSDYVKDALELAGSVAAFGATALGIALAIKQLKG